MPEGPDERLLDGIVCIVAITENGHGRSVYRSLVTVDEICECRFVTTTGCNHKPRVFV